MLARSAVAFLFVAAGVLVAGARSQCINTEVDHWFDAVPRVSDQYGTSVALSGDHAVVGSAGDNEFGVNAGAVFVYERSAGGWSFQGKLKADDTDGIVCLGTGSFAWTAQTAVATSGSVAIDVRPATPGQTRYFQFVYRDPSAAFCTPSAVNYSNGLALEW